MKSYSYYLSTIIFSIAIIVESILLLSSSTASTNLLFVDALFGPNITLTLNDPGTFSTTFSPRRIAVEVTLTFSGDSNILGPVEARIPITAASTKCRFTRFYWKEAGTFLSPLVYQITFRNPILTANAFEQDAYDAMKLIYLTIGASSRARIIASSVCVYFERLNVNGVDLVDRTFSAAETRCKATPGNFLCTLLKSDDDLRLRTALNAASGASVANFWIGVYAVDKRPALTFFCSRADPDFEESGCVDGGYYAYYRVAAAGGANTAGANTTGVRCIRPTGVACSGYSFDWDSRPVGNANTWNIRLRWESPNWLHWDREMNATGTGSGSGSLPHTMGSLCCDIAPYDRPSGDLCHVPTIVVDNPSLSTSLSMSVTNTLSETFSRKTFTKTFSETLLATPSLTDPGSPTVSETLTTTTTPSLSFSRSLSRSFTKTKSSTESISRSETESSTKSLSRSFSKSLSSTGSLSSSETISKTTTSTISFTIPPTQTRTLTSSKSATSSESESESDSRSSTRTPSVSVSLSRSLSSSRTSSSSKSETSSFTPTQSTTKTPTSSSTGSITETETKTETPTASLEPTPSKTATETQSESSTSSSTATKSKTETETATILPTPSSSISETVTESSSPTKSSSPTQSGTRTPSESETDTQSSTVSSTRSFTASLSNTDSVTESESKTKTPTTSLEPTPSKTVTESDSKSETESSTQSQTDSRSKTSSLSTSSSASQTDTDSDTVTQSSSSSSTKSSSPTVSSTDSATNSESKTQTPTTSLEPTTSKSITESLSSTSTDSATKSSTATNTGSQSASETESSTQSNSDSISKTTSYSTSSSNTQTETESETGTHSSTASSTKSSTLSSSSTNSISGSESRTEAASTSLEPTPSKTVTESDSKSATESSTPSTSDSISETASRSGSSSGTHSGTDTESATFSSSDSSTKSSTPSSSNTASVTDTESKTQTPTTSLEPTPSKTTTESLSASSTESDEATRTATFSKTKTGSKTSTDSSTASSSETESISASSTPSNSISSTGTSSSSKTESSTATSSQTSSLTSSSSVSESSTKTPTESTSLKPTSSKSSTFTDTETKSESETQTPSATSSSSQTSTSSVSETLSSSLTSSRSISQSLSSSVSSSISVSPSTSISTSQSNSITSTLTSSASSTLSRSGPTSTDSVTHELTATRDGTATGEATDTKQPTASKTSSRTKLQTRSKTDELTGTREPTASVTEFLQATPLRINIATTGFLASSFVLLALAGAVPPLSTLLQSMAAAASMGSASPDMLNTQIERLLVPFSIQIRVPTSSSGDDSSSSSSSGNTTTNNRRMEEQAVAADVFEFEARRINRRRATAEEVSCVTCPDDASDYYFGYVLGLVLLYVGFVFCHLLAWIFAYAYYRDWTVAAWKVRFPTLSITGFLLAQCGMCYLSGILIASKNSSGALIGTGIFLLVIVIVLLALKWKAAARCDDLMEEKSIDGIFEEREINYLVSIYPGNGRKYFTQGLFSGPTAQRWWATFDVVTPRWIRTLTLLHPVMGSLMCFLSGLSHNPDLNNAVAYVMCVCFILFSLFFIVYRPHRRPLNLPVTIILSCISASLALANAGVIKADVELMLCGIVFTWITLSATVASFVLEHSKWNKYFVAVRERKAIPRPNMDDFDCELEKAINPLEKDLYFNDFSDAEEDNSDDETIIANMVALDNNTSNNNDDQLDVTRDLGFTTRDDDLMNTTTIVQQNDSTQQAVAPAATLNESTANNTLNATALMVETVNDIDVNNNAEDPNKNQKPSLSSRQQQQESNNTSEEEIKQKEKRKKELSRMLNAWRKQFSADHDGTFPSETDIAANSKMSAIFKEYNEIKASLLGVAAVPDENNTTDKTPAAAARDDHSSSSTAVTNNTTFPDVETEKKHLNRQLNKWRKTFLQTHESQPTVADIDADPKMSRILERYNKLKAMKQHDNNKNDDDDNVPSPNNSTKPRPNLTASRQNEQEKEQEEDLANQSPEAQKHILNKKLNAWKRAFAAEHGGHQPTAGDISKDPIALDTYNKYLTLKGSKQLLEPYKSDEEETKKKDSSNENNNNTNTEEQNEEEDVLEARKLVLSKKLNIWRQAWKKEHGSLPNEKDINDDAEMKKNYDEYLSIKNRLASLMTAASNMSTSVGPGESTSAATASSSNNNNNNTSSTVIKATQAARRSELNKKLNAWKQQFAQKNDGKPPLIEDINKDPEMAAVYKEYTQLKAASVAHTVVAMASLSQQQQQDNNNMGVSAIFNPMSAASVVNNFNTTTANNDDDDENQQKQQRLKQLKKQIEKWRNEFSANHQREATVEDLDQDRFISSVYREYMRLKEEGKDNNTTNNSIDLHHLAASEQDLKQRKKQLNHELNMWKKEFQVANGTAPTAEDMTKVPRIKELYEEYLAIKNITTNSSSSTTMNNNLGASSLSSSANPPLLSASTTINNNTVVNASSSSLDAKKSRHKHLKKVINAWKREFEDLNGRPAEIQDIEQDVQLREQYAEYMLLRDDIHALEGTHQQLDATATTTQMAASSLVSPSPARGNNNTLEVTPQHQQQQNSDNNNKESSPEGIKKMLKHTLNQWKKDFQIRNLRPATEEDIQNDAEMKTVYEDYLTLKEALLANNHENDATSASKGAADTNSATSGGTSTPQQQALNFTSPGSPSATLSTQRNHHQHHHHKHGKDPHDARKKDISKFLAKYKKEFEEREAREPTQRDIESNPQMTKMYREYQILQRRKAINKDIDEFKQKWKNQFGSDPTHADLKSSDVKIKALVEEMEEIDLVLVKEFGFASTSVVPSPGNMKTNQRVVGGSLQPSDRFGQKSGGANDDEDYY